LDSDVNDVTKREGAVALKPSEIGAIYHRHNKEHGTLMFAQVKYRHNRRLMHLCYELCRAVSLWINDQIVGHLVDCLVVRPAGHRLLTTLLATFLSVVCHLFPSCDLNS
jgi:hypothetical protein